MLIVNDDPQRRDDEATRECSGEAFAGVRAVDM